MKCWTKNKKNPINRIKDIKMDYDYDKDPVKNVIGTFLSTKIISDKIKKEENDGN